MLQLTATNNKINRWTKEASPENFNSFNQKLPEGKNIDPLHIAHTPSDQQDLQLLAVHDLHEQRWSAKHDNFF